MRQLKILLIAFVFTLSLSPYVLAQESHSESTHKFSLNILGGSGFNFIGTEEFDLVYELSLTYRISPKIEVGFEYGMTLKERISAIDMNYFLSPNWFIGFQIGIKTKEHQIVFYGPQGGYDFFLSDNFSVGPEVQLMGSVQDQSIAIEGLASVKYHF